MSLFLKYFSGLSFKNNHIHVESTGAAIKLDRSFWQSAFSSFKIYAYFSLRSLKHVLFTPKSTGTIAFYPQTPGPWYNIWQVVRLARLRTVSDVGAADYVFVFEDTTYSVFDRRTLDAVQGIRLNARIQNISKEYVADIFEEVFPYSLRIDPMVHQGLAIKKSNDNGTHDGVVINCPIEPADVDPTQAYQRLVDSTFQEGMSEDLRVSWVLGKIALVYHKYKPLDDRFGTDYLSVDLKTPDEVFSPIEIELISNFCRRMELDFGAIDVMRDKHDGQIYIVDVNKTCMPVLSLNLKTQIKAQTTMTNAFNQGLELQAI